MTSHAIAVEHLVKRFGDFAAVDGLDLTVPTAEVHGFLGPNGAGKSTAIRVLLWLYRATSGRVRVLGLDPALRPADVTRQISYVPGEVNLWPNLTGREVLDALGGLRGERDEAAEKRLLDDFAPDPRKVVRTYSKGNRQKVLLVAAFAARTPLLILDEPTSGLDPLMEEVFGECVRKAAAEGRTVLLSSHILSEVEELCEAVTIIKDGRLVETGRLADLRHLAASRVAAVLDGHAGAEVMEGLRTLGVDNVSFEDGALLAGVARERVPAALQVIAGAGATDITCAPATLEDLFLRHYRVSAR